MVHSLVRDVLLCNLRWSEPVSSFRDRSFFLSALVSDLLLLRLFLFAAYIFLFTAALTGYPHFPQWGWQGEVWSA